MGNLISFMKEVAEGLRKSGNYGTAHVYRSSMNAISAFNGSRNLSFKKVNQEFLKSFETYLREKDCSWNTVSTYMRTLRAVYLSLIHISEPTRQAEISYAVFCLKKKKTKE